MLIMTSVFDVKAKAYSRPIPMLTEGEAIRSFSDAVNDKTSIYWKHPEDFILFLIGSFDEVAGDLIPADKPVPLAKAVNVRLAETDTK